MATGTVFSLIINMLFVLLLLSSSSSNVATAGRDIPSSVPSTMRPLSVDYVKMNPRLNPGHRPVFHEKEVKSCLPKGLRKSSAPSRDVNYEPLGSARCSPSNDKVHHGKP